MNSNTFFSQYEVMRFFRCRIHTLVILSCIGLAILGCMPEASAGWLSKRELISPGATTRYQKYGHRVARARQACWPYLKRTWRVPLLRSGLVSLLWYWSNNLVPVWVIGLPWATWCWEVLGLCWPWMERQAEWRAVRWLGRQVERLVLVWMLSWLLIEGIRMLLLGQLPFTWENAPWVLGACVSCGNEEPVVSVETDKDEGHTVTMKGNFTLHVASDDPFRKRLLILFLRLLEVPGSKRGSRRTRDGRTPFVRQQYLAAKFSIPQPNISRWEGYWLARDWRRLLSLHAAEVLTLELQAQIVRVFVQFPWWGVDKVYRHLHEQSVMVTHRQVRQASEESGWSLLRKELRKRYHLTSESFRPKDEWLVTQLLTQVQTLLEKLASGNKLTPQKEVEIADLQVICDEIGVAVAAPLRKALPWLLRVEHVLFGSWEDITDEQVRCVYCGSTQVARKSRKPRLKKYYDSKGKIQTVEVFRY